MILQVRNGSLYSISLNTVITDDGSSITFLILFFVYSFLYKQGSIYI